MTKTSRSSRAKSRDPGALSIGFAMECVERKWLDAPWLQFGSGEAMLRAIELIGSRTGLGDLLAEGSRRAAHIIGHNSIAIAPQVKGLEIPGYEPRGLQTMALGFAVGPRGAVATSPQSHRSGTSAIRGKFPGATATSRTV